MEGKGQDGRRGPDYRERSSFRSLGIEFRLRVGNNMSNL